MLKEELEKRKITISLRVFDPQDLAIGWEVKSIVENPDIFENFFLKYPLKPIEIFDDYFLYLLALKLESLSASIPFLLQEEHKLKIKSLSEAAQISVRELGPASVIKYINKNIEEIFNAEVSKHDIRFVTLDIIAKYNMGISKEAFSYICNNFGYLIIDRFELFESAFEREPDLFQSLFPSGKIEDINPYRLEKVLEIWQHITLKGKSNLKDSVSRKIPLLFNDIVALAESASIENVMQIEGTIRKFNNFLQRIQSPLANKFSQHAKNIETLLSENILERGHSFKYEIPVEEIIQRWKATPNWEIRLLSVTHDPIKIDEQYTFVSRLDKRPESKSVLMDLVSTNIPTDDYYTMSHQQKLSINASIGIGTIIGIIREQETASDFCSLLSSAVKFISDKLHAEGEMLEQDLDHLITMVQLVVDNHNSDEKIVHSLCYGATMFLCAFSEKLLRLFYLNLVKDRQYVPINKATLGELLNENNTDMLNAFGFHHIKSLSFFLMQTSHKNIGYNIRNNLAHWAGLSMNTISPTFMAQMLWLFTDILNTVFWYFLKDSMEGD